MGFLSKVWKGIKKTVKKAAKSVKKLAKKVAYAIPGGKQLWKLGGKIGKAVMKGVGKITSALGPIGMIGLSVLAPYAAPLWSAFGAASTAAAASGSIWGTIGQAIYNGANWVGGTLSSMTSGISKGLSTIAEGGLKNLGTSLGKAGSEMLSGFTKAFSGEAGSLAIDKGTQAAIQSSIKQAAGQSVLDQVKGEVLGTTLQKPIDTKLPDFTQELKNYEATGSFTLTPEQMAKNMKVPELPDITDLGTKDFSVGATQRLVEDSITSKVAGPSLLSKATDVAKSVLSTQPTPTYQQPQSIGDVGGQRFEGNAFARGGIASSGGDLLTEHQRQLQQQSAGLITRGFA